jgi:hypothetical protein
MPIMEVKTDSTNATKPRPAGAPTLNPEDQARVDAFLSRGVNAVPRKPFRPMLLMILLIVVVTSLSLLSLGLARYAGIY